MNIFEIIGPVMVGPSSSHTAGAARIGFVARNLLGEEVKEAEDTVIWIVSGYRKRTWYRPCTGRRSDGDEAR